MGGLLPNEKGPQAVGLRPLLLPYFFKYKRLSETQMALRFIYFSGLSY
jgi:hypothetical protein